MKKVKTIAVVGAGWRALSWLNVIKKMPGVALGEVVCRNAENAVKIKNLYPCARVVSDISEIERADHVLICVKLPIIFSVAGFRCFAKLPRGSRISNAKN